MIPIVVNYKGTSYSKIRFYKAVFTKNAFRLIQEARNSITQEQLDEMAEKKQFMAIDGDSKSLRWSNASMIGNF